MRWRQRTWCFTIDWCIRRCSTTRPPTRSASTPDEVPVKPCADRQPHIHDQMIAHARLGQAVVRLKGGDPFVFGRGGEEMLALARAGIPFEVIPGVSSAISVPGSALVPVTHRGVSAAFGVFTAHEASSAASSSIDWSLAARMPTAVFLMGALRLETIVDHLMRHGRRPDTPAIAIERGTLADQRIYCGTLADIREVARDLATPATLVVGEVVALRDRSTRCEPAGSASIRERANRLEGSDLRAACQVSPRSPEPPGSSRLAEPGRSIHRRLKARQVYTTTQCCRPIVHRRTLARCS